MTTMEMLKNYRATILEIEDLQQQLEKACPTGAPSGGRSMATGLLGPSTNDPLAAALQLADGLEAIIHQKRTMLAELGPQLYQVLAAITNGRVLQVIQCYYLLAQTDEQIGHRLGLSTTRINQIRNQYIRSAS